MFEQLNERERMLVMATGALLGLLLVFFLGFSIYRMRQKIAEEVVAARNDLTAIINIRSDIRSLPSGSEIPEMNDFLSRVSTLIKKHNLDARNISEGRESNRRDQEETLTAELQFSGIPLNNIISFLHDVEYGNQIPAGRVKELTFRKPFPNREIYDIRLVLMVKRPIESAKPGGE